jgi:L-alanine-DL-glutamate epimerase-like enolase superfamily enzyme
VKVTEVETFVVGNPPPSFGGAYFVIAKLVTDDGLVGYGEAYGATFRPNIVAAVIRTTWSCSGGGPTAAGSRSDQTSRCRGR